MRVTVRMGVAVGVASLLMLAGVASAGPGGRHRVIIRGPVNDAIER
jgi:hypothetical protein